MTVLHAGGKFGGGRIQSVRRIARRRRFRRQRVVRMAGSHREAGRKHSSAASIRRGVPTAELRDHRRNGRDTAPMSRSSRIRRFSRKRWNSITTCCSPRLRELAFLNTRHRAFPSKTSAAERKSATRSSTKAAFAQVRRIFEPQPGDAASAADLYRRAAKTGFSVEIALAVQRRLRENICIRSPTTSTPTKAGRTKSGFKSALTRDHQRLRAQEQAC